MTALIVELLLCLALLAAGLLNFHRIMDWNSAFSLFVGVICIVWALEHKR